MVSIWEHEDQPHVRDYLMAIIFATLFPVARLLLDSLIFEVMQIQELNLSHMYVFLISIF
jgi:hypothetical protein